VRNDNELLFLKMTFPVPALPLKNCNVIIKSLLWKSNGNGKNDFVKVSKKFS